MEETPRVVLAEDDGDVRRLVDRTLEGEFGVEGFDDGSTCWQRLQADPVPDVLLLDVTMPGMDGVELYERVRDDDRLAGVSVFFLTGRSETDVAAEVDADVEIVSKPFSPSDLRDRLRRLEY